MNSRSAYALCWALLFSMLPSTYVSMFASATESSDAARQLKLVPEPKEVQLHEGGFRVGPLTKILVEFGHQDEDRIAAETLAEEIADQSGLKLDIVGVKATSRAERSAIVLARLQDLSVRKFLEGKGLKSDASIGEQGYLLFADKSHLVVAANSGQGLFYGVQTLRQLLRPQGKALVCPAVGIRDWPSLEWRGVQDDISRGPISTHEFMKKQVKTLAAFKSEPVRALHGARREYEATKSLTPAPELGFYLQP